MANSRTESRYSQLRRGSFDRIIIPSGSVEEAGYEFINQESVNTWVWTLGFPTLLSKTNRELKSSILEFGNLKFEICLLYEISRFEGAEPQSVVSLALQERSAANFQYSLSIPVDQMKKIVTIKENYLINDEKRWIVPFRVAKYIRFFHEGSTLGKQLQVVCKIYGLRALFDSSSRIQKLDHFENLLNNKKFSDFKIKVGDRFIHAHKAILASESEVFSSMLAHNMLEKEQNILKIDDVEYDVMMELLRYIYIGKVNNIENVAVRLMIAADKYCLESLRYKCEVYICHELSIDNVLKCIMFADTHNASELKEFALQFFVKHKHSIVNLRNFDEMMKKMNPDLTTEMIKRTIRSR